VIEYAEEHNNVLAFSNAKTRGIEDGEIKDVSALNDSMKQVIQDLEEQIGRELKGELLVSSSCGEFKLEEVTEESLLSEKEEILVTEEHVVDLKDNLLNHISPDNDKNSMHLFVKKFVLDDKKIVGNPVGMRAKKLSAVFNIVMGSEHYRNVVEYATGEILGEAEYYISFISNAEAVLSDVEKDRGVLHVDLGYDSTFVTLYHANTPIELERVDTAMKHVIKDIAVVLQTSLQEAERLLRTYGISVYQDVEPKVIEYKGLDGRSIRTTNQEFLSRIIYARLRGIFMKIRKLYRDYTFKYQQFSNIGIPGGIVFSGGGAMLQRIEEHASEVFKCPVRIGTLANSDRFESESEEVYSALYAATFGNILVYEMEQNVYGSMIGERKRHSGQGIFKKLLESLGKIFG
ncbi:MAG: cell division protein FtsA, partial [Fervidobacterium sp.]